MKENTFVLVPLEPTEAMMDAYRWAFTSDKRFDMREVWKAMLAVVPLSAEKITDDMVERSIAALRFTITDRVQNAFSVRELVITKNDMRAALEAAALPAPAQAAQGDGVTVGMAEAAIQSLAAQAVDAGEDLKMGYRVTQTRMVKALEAALAAQPK